MARKQIVAGTYLTIEDCPKLNDPMQQAKMIGGTLYLRSYNRLCDCLMCRDYKGDDGSTVDCARED